MSYKIHLDVWDKCGLIDVLQDVPRCFGTSLVVYMSYKMYRDVLGQVWLYRCLTRCTEMFWDKFGCIYVL